MEKLKQEDRDKLSQVLHDNWDNIFKFLAGSSVDEDNVPYREVYKWELLDREKEFPDLIDIYLKNDAFFNKDSIRDWLIQEIVGALLGYTDCRKVEFYGCVNQLYYSVFHIVKPYFVGLYLEKQRSETVKVIETNISMKNGDIFDHQSRVVEVNSWEDYCKTFEEYDGSAIGWFNSITSIVGNSIPKDVIILNLTYNDHNLTCEFKHRDGWIGKKLSYKSKFRYDV